MMGARATTARQYRPVGLRRFGRSRSQKQPTPIHNPSTRRSGKKEPWAFRSRGAALSGNPLGTARRCRDHDPLVSGAGRKRLTYMKAKQMPVVLTIGHSTRTWTAFLDLLRAHQVKRVIDVRTIPRSRHNPQFDRVTLSKKLRAARIGYVHLRKLGG